MSKKNEPEREPQIIIDVNLIIEKHQIECNIYEDLLNMQNMQRRQEQTLLQRKNNKIVSLNCTNEF